MSKKKKKKNKTKKIGQQKIAQQKDSQPKIDNKYSQKDSHTKYQKKKAP